MRALGVAGAATWPPVPHWAAPTWRGATPQAEGLVRARGRARFHAPAPAPWGRSRSISPWREGCQTPRSAADQASASRLVPIHVGDPVVYESASVLEQVSAPMGGLDFQTTCARAASTDPDGPTRQQFQTLTVVAVSSATCYSSRFERSRRRGFEEDCRILVLEPMRPSNLVPSWPRASVAGHRWLTPRRSKPSDEP